MTVLWVGADMDCFDSSVGSGQSWVTTSGWFDAAYQDGAIRPNTLLRGMPFTAETEMWFHTEMRHDAVWGFNYDFLLFTNSSGVDVVRFQKVSYSTTMRIDLYNGSSLADSGVTFTLPKDQLTQIDVHIVAGSSGLVEVYINQNLAASVAVPYSDVNNIASVGLCAITDSSGTYATYSQTLVADESTIGWQMYTNRPTSDGTYTDWTGSYADVDEPLNNDTDYISAGTSGYKQTMKAASRGTIDLEVKAIAVSARASRDSSGPQNFDLMLRNGSSDHFVAVPVGIGFGSKQAFWHTDPDTSAAWSAADAASASLEFGVRART